MFLRSTEGIDHELAWRNTLFMSETLQEIYYNKNHKLVQFEIGNLVKLKIYTKSDANKKKK